MTFMNNENYGNRHKKELLLFMIIFVRSVLAGIFLGLSETPFWSVTVIFEFPMNTS